MLQGVINLSLEFEPLSDEDLMSIYQSGDIDALGFLIKRLRPKMDQVVRSQILDRELANDAIQEACITIFRNAKSFRGDSKVFTWVYRLLINSCIDLLRKEKIRTSQNIDDEALISVADENSNFADQKVAELAINSAMLKLPEEQRIAVSMVWIDGFTIEQTAQLLGIPIGTVKSRCDRGKKALAEILKDLDPNMEPNSPKRRLRNGGKSE
jgi:RNA polymerase sigma-70 factor (ECF subfamily)